MKVLRKIIEINEDLCDGCGQCVPACAEGAIRIVDGKARVVENMFCDGLGACLGECPIGALRIIERKADEFDEEAVEKHIASFTPKSCEEANKPVVIQESESALSHWPVQIRLVPAKAPFFKGADLLVLADCVAVQ